MMIEHRFNFWLVLTVFVVVFGAVMWVGLADAQELPPHLRPVEVQLYRDYAGCNGWHVCWRVGDAQGEPVKIMILQDSRYYLTEDTLLPTGAIAPAGAYVMTGYVFFRPDVTAVFVGNGVDEHCLGDGAWLAPGGVPGIPYVTKDGVVYADGAGG